MLEENKVNDEYFGFPLFSEIEEKSLRDRNRAVTMANILEDNFNKGKITVRGTALISGYFSKIPEEERTSVFNLFKDFCKERGFELTTR